ncbi:MAG TPA: SDR family oxidoreductase [Pseudonocardia sp.]|jgi:NAD(P)-dependent dehydrogenase (short-subunit alcohol dehydrogenase family)
MSQGDRRMYGQVGLVTGAASGIGEAVALRLGAEGATVMCLDINDAGAVAKQINDSGDGSAEAHQMDVTDAAGWARVTADVAARLGRIDFLVNVAGIPVMDPDVADTVVTLTEEWFDRVIAVNLKGSWLGMRAVIPHLRASGGGRIVNTSSLSSTMGVPSLAAYSASKGGIDALTRQAAAEYAPENILVNAVSPGVIRTPLLAAQPEEFQRANAAKHLINRLGEPVEIASMVAYLLTEGGFATGAVMAVDGGWSVKG